MSLYNDDVTFELPPPPPHVDITKNINEKHGFSDAGDVRELNFRLPVYMAGSASFFCSKRCYSGCEVAECKNVFFFQLFPAQQSLIHDSRSNIMVHIANFNCIDMA